MTETTPDAPAGAAENLAIAVEHKEFCENLPLGRYRVIINPHKADRFLKHKLFIMGVTVPLIGIGIALVLWGFIYIGLALGAIGFALPRIIKHQAGRILLHLALNDAKTYYDAIEYEIMEVRLSRD